MSFHHKTQSLCDICFKKVPAYTFIKNGTVFLKKECPRHGRFEEKHFWDDPEIYRKLLKIKTTDPQPANLSIALTYRCNLKCPVCYAKASEMPSKDFNPANLEKIKNYKGILLTGGEPTMRQDLPGIIKKIRNSGKRVTIFTNGLKLASKKYLRRLEEVGLSSIIIQFDTLDSGTAVYMRGQDLIEVKKRAIQNIQRIKIPLYLYSVMLKDKNSGNISKILKFAFQYPVIKMVSFNTMGTIGRCDKEDFLPTSQIVSQVCKTLGIEKSEWIESSEFLNTMDKFPYLKKRSRRIFSKCSLKCLLLKHRGKLIPITRVFDILRINREVEEAYSKGKGRFRLFLFAFSLFYREVLLNFFRNINFRIFLISALKNIKYLFGRNYSLLNPFFIVAVTVVPSLENIDQDFLKECNIYSVTPGNLSPRPACIYRVTKNK